MLRSRCERNADTQRFPVTNRVLHADFIALAPDAQADARTRLVEAASLLTEMEPVLAAAALDVDAGQEFDVAFFFLLADLSGLERFGTDTRYSRFLQADVAPVLRSLAGIDVSLEADLPPDGRAACITLAAPDHTYDFELRAALDAWSRASGGTAAIGLAVGERQRYRGLALVSGDAVAPPEPPGGRFGATILTGKLVALP